MDDATGRDRGETTAQQAPQSPIGMRANKLSRRALSPEILTAKHVFMLPKPAGSSFYQTIKFTSLKNNQSTTEAYTWGLTFLG